jgi:hypothetical protein
VIGMEIGESRAGEGPFADQEFLLAVGDEGEDVETDLLGEPQAGEEAFRRDARFSRAPCNSPRATEG